jgi:hypothetical protein
MRDQVDQGGFMVAVATKMAILVVQRLAEQLDIKVRLE